MSINLNYKHDKNNFIEAIGCSEDMYSVAMATIVYETIAPHLQASMLYNDVSEIPDSFHRNKSQVLEHALKRVESDISTSLVLLLVFERTHDKALDQFKELGDFLEHKPSRIKADSLEDAIKQVVSKMKLMQMVDMISFLKENNCDYDKFIAFCSDQESDKTSSSRNRDYSDIDEMIKKAMNDTDEETEE